MLHIDRVINSFFASNTYILTDDDLLDCWLVDIGDVGNIVVMRKRQQIESNKAYFDCRGAKEEKGETFNEESEMRNESLNIKGVLLTHTHYDHIYGLNYLLKKFPDAVVYTNEFGKNALQSPKINFSRYHEKVEDFILLKPENVRVIEDGDKIKLYDDTSVEVIATPGHDESCLTYMINNSLFTGDSYIPGLKVVTTFPYSNKGKALLSEQRIISLAHGCNIYPGHEPNLNIYDGEI